MFKRNVLIMILVVIRRLKGFWQEGHMIIARIAELDLHQTDSGDILLKAYEVLESIREFFPENKDSFLEAATAPDILTSEYKQFLVFFHFIN